LFALFGAQLGTALHKHLNNIFLVLTDEAAVDVAAKIKQVLFRQSSERFVECNLIFYHLHTERLAHLDLACAADLGQEKQKRILELFRL
jgi:hypothetical protein